VELALAASVPACLLILLPRASRSAVPAAALLTLAICHCVRENLLASSARKPSLAMCPGLLLQLFLAQYSSHRHSDHDWVEASDLLDGLAIGAASAGDGFAAGEAQLLCSIVFLLQLSPWKAILDLVDLALVAHKLLRAAVQLPAGGSTFSMLAPHAHGREVLANIFPLLMLETFQRSDLFTFPATGKWLSPFPKSSPIDAFTSKGL